MRMIRNMLAVALAAAAAGGAHAQVNDPSMYTSKSYGSSYRGASGSDTVVLAPVFVNANGGSQFRLNTLQVGLYRSATAPAVDIEVSIRPMTFDAAAYTYGVGAAVATGTATLDASTASVISTLTWTWGSADPSTRPIVNLETVSNGPNGYGGMWVGLRFVGANAADTTNGWMVTNEPSVGRGPNRFGKLTVSTNAFTNNYWFSTTTGTDGVSRENNARFAADVGGVVLDAVAPGADYVYGQMLRYSYWKPYDGVTTGNPAYTFYSSNFVTASAGQVLRPTSVSLSIYRGGTAQAPVPAADVELALCKMTYDGTNYGVGDAVATTTIHIDADSTKHSQKLVWSIPAGSVVLPLNTDNAANPNLGGYWIRGRFIGGAYASAQGVEIGYLQQLGASYNSFCMFDSTNTLMYYTFGQYNSQSGTDSSGNPVYYRLPARFITDVYGAVGNGAPPCPADLNADGQVNGADLGLMLGAWGPCSGACPADLNVDGQVNGADLGLMLGAWGACPQ